MAGMLRVPRSRGAFSGVLLVLLGIWGGIIPFVGPYVHYAYTPDRAWTYTSGRLWLEFLPAIGAVIGGLIVAVSRLRPAALLGAWLAALTGCWFAIGGALAPLWTSDRPAQGTPVGGSVARAVEQSGFFTGLGVMIVCVASIALGRLSVLTVRDIKSAERATTAADQATGRTRRPVGARRVGARGAVPAGAPDRTSVPAAADTQPGRTVTPRARLVRVAGRHSAPDADTDTATDNESVSTGAARR
jgi:hypothetical protein